MLKMLLIKYGNCVGGFKEGSGWVRGQVNGILKREIGEGGNGTIERERDACRTSWSGHGSQLLPMRSI